VAGETTSTEKVCFHVHAARTGPRWESGDSKVQVAAPGLALTGCWRLSLGQVRDRAARTELVPGRRQPPGTTGSSTFNISGNYHHPGVSSNPTRVYNQALSHSGALDLVMGDFTSAGGPGSRSSC
jgi:hypothetical protein